MDPHAPTLPGVTPNRCWQARIFGAKSVQAGGVVRRKIRDVHREIGREALIAEVKARGFHLLECGDQYVIICNSGQLRVVC